MPTAGELADAFAKIRKDKVVLITNMSDHFSESDFEVATDYDDTDSIDIIMGNYVSSTKEMPYAVLKDGQEIATASTEEIGWQIVHFYEENHDGSYELYDKCDEVNLSREEA